MQTEHLPTEDLKKFGIINEDLSFSKNLKADDIQKFLQGYTIVADNDKNRATFQLTEQHQTQIFLERTKAFLKLSKTARKELSIPLFKTFQSQMNRNFPLRRRLSSTTGKTTSYQNLT
jgi:hypothetical protein